MKRIVITIAAVVVAAVAAQAQSPSVEARMLGDMMANNGRLAQVTKNEQDVLQQRITNAATRAQAQAAKKTNDAKKAPAKKADKKAPAKKAPAKKAEATQKAPAKKADKKQGNNNGITAYIKAAFGMGPLPGETEEQYYERLTQPAALPFK